MTIHFFVRILIKPFLLFLTTLSYNILPNWATVSFQTATQTSGPSNLTMTPL